MANKIIYNARITDFDPGTIVMTLKEEPDRIHIVCDRQDNGNPEEVKTCYAVCLNDGTIWTNETFEDDFEILKYKDEIKEYE